MDPYVVESVRSTVGTPNAHIRSVSGLLSGRTHQSFGPEITPKGHCPWHLLRFLRAFAVWLILLIVESIHGVFRRLVLEPWIGDLPARQISVFIGAVLILIITYFSIDWIKAKTVRQLTLIGVMWALLTVVFEIGLGRFVFDYSWERVLSDFNLRRGGLLSIGLLIMGLAPRITASFRRRRSPVGDAGFRA